MKFIIGDTNYPHKPGEFSRKQIASCYHVLYFKTPYVYETNDCLCEGKKDDMLITPPGALSYIGPASHMTEGFVNDWAFIDGLEPILEKYPLPLNEPFSVQKNNYLHDCITELNKEKVNKFKGHHLKMDCIITQMIIDVHRAYIKEREHSSQYNIFLNLRRTVRKNLDRKWTLEEMSAISNYSKSRFSNLYKHYFGISPIEDVINMKLEKAKQMLKSPYFSVGETAAACGFESIYYFSLKFKQTVGISPSEYAKKNCNSII